MRQIIRRLRYLLGVLARRVKGPAAIAVAVYATGRIAGWQPHIWDGLIYVAAVLSARVVLGVRPPRTRRGRPLAAYRRPVPVYEAPPAPDPEVLLLVEQGRKIPAIARYREQNPGIGLKQAKDVIDALPPG